MTRIRQIAITLIATLREIFDESAYARFLTQQGMFSCPRAYAAFLREQESTKARRPKCC
jgi:aspartate/tyrosine/aromatic aminotransferase